MGIPKNMNATKVDGLDRTRYVPIQRHFNNTVPVVRYNLPLRLRSASTWAGIGAGCRYIREDHARLFVKLTGKSEGASPRNTGRAWLSVCSATAPTTGRLRVTDPLAANRTGRGALKPLLLATLAGECVIHHGSHDLTCKQLLCSQCEQSDSLITRSSSWYCRCVEFKG
jgi:hypothetical protein